MQLNTKKGTKKVYVGMVGYYRMYKNFNNYTFRTYTETRDTFYYFAQSLNNSGLGLFFGISNEFMLFKTIDFVSGMALRNLINVQKSSAIYS